MGLKNKLQPIRGLTISLFAISIAVSCGNGAQVPPVSNVEDGFVTTLTTVFEAGKDGHILFRIPALVQTNAGTLLAFCEARNTGVDFYKGHEDMFSAKPVGNGDLGDIDLVLKRSCDGGKTWSELVYVADDMDNTCGNPVPVVDPETGRVHLFWCWQQFPVDALQSDFYDELPDHHTRRVLYCYSDDDGLTWSESVDLTSSLKDDSWSWYATGPCHGIIKAVDPYKGRIIIPANHRDSTHTLNYSHVIYSDDKGASWKLGGTTGLGGNESCAVELEDGSILLNMRIHGNTVEGGCRAYSISGDGGDTWGDFIRSEELIDPGCQGSVINYFDEGKPSGTLLLTNVHETKTRKNLAVSKSEDSGASWTTPFVFWYGAGAYSDICRLSDGSLCILYENGFGKYGRHRYYERISLYNIPESLIKTDLGI